MAAEPYLHSLASLYMALAVQKLLNLPKTAVERAIAETDRSYRRVSPPPDLYVGIIGLAGILRVSPCTIRRRINEGRLGIESVWFGKRRFFDRNAVREWTSRPNR